MNTFRRPTDQIERKQYTSADFSRIRSSCVATNVSRANRVVGRIYEEAFRDVSISSPQFELLVSLMIKPGSTAGEIAENLSADPSTVSRNTELLIKRNLVTVTQCTKDRRVRVYCLTEEGEAIVQSCVPRWKQAQRTALKKLRRSAWHDVRRALRRLARP